MNYKYWKKYITYELVPSQHVLDNYDNKIFPDNNYQSHDEMFNILTTVIKNKVSRSDHIGLLAGGGTDSTLLLVLLNSLGYKKVTCVSYITGNNDRSLEFVDKFCEEYKFKHLKIASNSDLESEYFEKFKKLKGREPRDIIAPVHNLLIDTLKKQKCAIIVDGQYADSVLKMNPQNQVINLIEKYHKIPFLFSLISFNLKVIIEINKFFSLKKVILFYKKFFYFSSSKKEDIICNICRIEKSHDTKKLIKNEIKSNGINHTYQKLFNNCLLTYREKDKYELNEVFSPFKYIGLSKNFIGKKEQFVIRINQLSNGNYEKDSSSFMPN